MIGSPLFDRATINLENGRKFTVETINNSDQNIYIQRIELNGQPYSLSYIRHEDILKGGTLRITMGSEPNKEYGALINSRP